MNYHSVINVLDCFSLKNYSSILSQQMFNKFINHLLNKLKSMNTGVRIYDFHLNMFAYADDINLVSTSYRPVLNSDKLKGGGI